jgi:hypothetical protein
LRVDFLEVGGNIEDEAELAGDAIFRIAEQIERDAVFLLAVAKIGLSLRRNGDERCSQRIELRFCGFQSCQLQVAVGSPDAAIEIDDERSAREQLPQAATLALRVQESEFRRAGSRFHNALCNA